LSSCQLKTGAWTGRINYTNKYYTAHTRNTLSSLSLTKSYVLCLIAFNNPQDTTIHIIFFIVKHYHKNTKGKRKFEITCQDNVTALYPI